MVKFILRKIFIPIQKLSDYRRHKQAKRLMMSYVLKIKSYTRRHVK
jgi:hypothetical protein